VSTISDIGPASAERIVAAAMAVTPADRQKLRTGTGRVARGEFHHNSIKIVTVAVTTGGLRPEPIDYDVVNRLRSGSGS
jgi:hypothetical protein